MDERLVNLQLGAMLHYFGKIVRRANSSEVELGKHQFIGEQYLNEVVPELLEIDELSSINKVSSRKRSKNYKSTI